MTLCTVIKRKILYIDIINWKIKSTEKGKWMLKRLFSNLLPYHIWDKRTIKDEFAYSILFELSNGKKTIYYYG